MLNIFVKANEYGQVIGATFNFEEQVLGTKLNSRKITPHALSGINNPFYERQINMQKVAMLYQAGQIDEVNRINKAIYSENIRVNSLYLLCRELRMLDGLFNSPETKEKYANKMIICYIPVQLLRELHEGKHKIYLIKKEEKHTTYYSKFELDLWAEAEMLIANLYEHLLFRNIANCDLSKSVSNKPFSQSQIDRNTLLTSLNNLLQQARIKMREQRRALVNINKEETNKTAAKTDDPIFNENGIDLNNIDFSEIEAVLSVDNGSGDNSDTNNVFTN